MARKKDTSDTPAGNNGSLEGETDADSIQAALTDAAQQFAQEILRLLAGATLAELTQLAGRAAPDAGEGVVVRRGPGRPPKAAAVAAPTRTKPPQKRPSPRTSALRRMAGTKPVVCPFPDCQNPGVRSKMNFCSEHAEQLPKAERARLRQLQRANHQVERTILPENLSGKRAS